MKLAIRTEKLSRRFGRTVAVDHVDLAVPEGAIYALVGANGAGKTTIIKMLMNIFSPSEGHAEVLGVDARRIDSENFRRSEEHTSELQSTHSRLSRLMLDIQKSS